MAGTTIMFKYKSPRHPLFKIKGSLNLEKPTLFVLQKLQ